MAEPQNQCGGCAGATPPQTARSRCVAASASWSAFQRTATTKLKCGRGAGGARDHEQPGARAGPARLRGRLMRDSPAGSRLGLPRRPCVKAPSDHSASPSSREYRSSLRPPEVRDLSGREPGAEWATGRRGAASSARAVAASRWSAAVPVEDHDGGVVAEVAAGGAQNRGAERVDHFAARAAQGRRSATVGGVVAPA